MKIAFGYSMGVGKDTCGIYLKNKYGGHIFHFSDPLYDIQRYAQHVCDFVHVKDKDRAFLQFVGTEWARSRDPDVWLKCLLKKAKTFNDQDNLYICDLRFPNEFAALKEQGWKCVKIVRKLPHQILLERQGTGSCSHSSENALAVMPDSMWDKIIVNDSSLTTMFSQLDELMMYNQ